ncbi:hypothetical protein M0R19_05190 [Candidatus Pacearchaeota archaeon]|jgi:hypothetical protein|nr:hypothetical protein [Candidatus Pacearchaeota archaeon]
MIFYSQYSREIDFFKDIDDSHGWVSIGYDLKCWNFIPSLAIEVDYGEWLLFIGFLCIYFTLSIYPAEVFRIFLRRFKWVK